MEHLIEAADGTLGGGRVLDLGYEGQVLAIHLKDDLAGVCFVSPDIRAVRAAEKAFGSLASDAFRASLEHDLSGHPENHYDAVIYQPPRWESKHRIFQLMDRTWALLREGGRIFLGGRKQGGVESYRDRLRAVFGDVNLHIRLGANRVYVSVKQGHAPEVEQVDPRRVFRDDHLPGGPYEFISLAGVFSHGEVDDGTRLLIQALELSDGDRILDLACGYGAIGIAAATIGNASEAVFLDASLMAVECARENIRQNGLAVGRAEVADGLESIEDASFDLICSNPPSHEGRVVADSFVTGARRCLRKDGRLWVVSRRPGLYRQAMTRSFATVAEVVSRDGFTVLKSDLERA